MMTSFKTAVLAFLTIAMTHVAHAGDFLTDFETAKKKAVAEDKPLLVKFTGSDWCPPCKQLDKAVFSQKKFKTAVEKDFVVVILDFPKAKKLSEEQTKANRKVATEYKVRGYPTVMLMDKDGKAFKSMVGYDRSGVEDGNDVEVYLKKLKTALKARKFQ